MQPNNSGVRRRALSWIMAAALTGALGGCYDYLERRDTVTLGVGDAVATNKATQTINRWPSASRQDRWLSDGERARIAASRYRSRHVPDPKSLDNGGVEAEPDLGGNATAGNGK